MRRKRETKGILFLGLLVWHLETGKILSGREGGKCIEQKGDKEKGRRRKAFLFFTPIERSGLEKNKLIFD